MAIDPSDNVSDVFNEKNIDADYQKSIIDSDSVFIVKPFDIDHQSIVINRSSVALSLTFEWNIGKRKSNELFDLSTFFYEYSIVEHVYPMSLPVCQLAQGYEKPKNNITIDCEFSASIAQMDCRTGINA